MADDTSGTNSTLAFIVGGLVVAVGVLVYMLYGRGPGPSDVNIQIDVPEAMEPLLKKSD